MVRIRQINSPYHTNFSKSIPSSSVDTQIPLAGKVALATFYTKVTDLKLLDQLTEFCSRIHTVDAVDIPQVMKTIYKDAEGIPQFINVMEVAQRKSKRAKLVINDEYLHAVALKSLLQASDYETETREWSKLPEDEQTWTEWKTTFRAAHVAKRRSEAAREGEETPFGGSALFGGA